MQAQLQVRARARPVGLRPCAAWVRRALSGGADRFRRGLRRTVRETRVRDLVLAACCVAAWFAVLGIALASPFWYPVSIRPYVVIGLSLLPILALRRSAPSTVFWLTALLGPMSVVGLPGTDVGLLPLLLTAYFAAVASRLPVVLLGLGAVASAAAVSMGMFLVLNLDHLFTTWLRAPAQLGFWFDPSGTLVRMMLALASVVMGTLVGRLQRVRETLEERNAALVALQEVRAQSAVQVERSRIARELHDVVAHHVSAIVIRAQAADLVADTDPGQPRNAVRWIAVSGREALDAMRSVVRVLRDDVPVPVDREAPTEAVPMHPVGTLAELSAVIARVADAGLRVDADLPQPLPALPTAAELAVLRVAQEALTNVLLHSGANRATVRLDVADGWVTLVVADPGPGADSVVGAGGHGLMHMRERASSAGGTVTAGPVGAGWRVELVVPVGAAR